MVCPGWNYTQLFRYSSIPWYSWIVIFPVALWFMKPARIVMSFLFKCLSLTGLIVLLLQGIQSIIYCTVAEETENETGLFYRDCKVYQSNADLNSESVTALWELSCNMCRDKL